MKSPGRLAVGCLLAVSIAACSDALGPEEDDLGEARALWAQTAPGGYTYVFRRSCFCPPDFVRPIRIDVIGQDVIEATYADDGEPVATPLDEVPTIEDLFDEIEDAIEGEAASVVATYDAEYGHPVSVSIDHIAQAVDDETAFVVQEFELLALPLQSAAR